MEMVFIVCILGALCPPYSAACVTTIDLGSKRYA